MVLEGRIISMPKSERRARCVASWERVLDKATVFDAVIGKDVSDTNHVISTDLFKRLHTNSRWNPFHWEDDKMTNKSHVGCALSHITLWNECVQRNMPLIIIEDDVVVHSSRSDIQSLVEGKDFISLIYMSKTHCGKMKTANPFWGTQAYFVTPQAAAVLLQDAYPVSLHIDRYMAYTAQRYDTNWDCACPKLKYTCIGNSTLSHDIFIKLTIWISAILVVVCILVTLSVLLRNCMRRCS